MNPRDELTEYLRSQLIGPVDGEKETLEGPPDSRYLMGTLYPRESDLHGQLDRAAQAIDGAGTELEPEDTTPAADPLPESNAWLPSSIGISFHTDAQVLTVRCSAARYATEKSHPRRWRREPLPQEDHRIGPGASNVSVFGGRGELRILRRDCGAGELITVALANSAESIDGKGNWEDMLFQVGLEIGIVDGRLLEYPAARLVSRDHEEQELRLQYRHVRTYAVGNGCAVGEKTDDTGTVVALAASFMPQVDVPGVRSAGPRNAPALGIAHLADPDVPLPLLRTELEGFAKLYRHWYEGQRKAEFPQWGAEAAARILARIGTAVERIESGVRTLCDPSRPEILKAFRLANHAMALQMRHNEEDLGGNLRDRIDDAETEPEIDAAAAWKPFQLAFFLLALDGTADPAHSDRGTADLIWFPTGGGKTEAYLLLAAFAMLLRREQAGGGTAVLSRYTLSLLTTQQFQRTAATICALEALRRDGRHSIKGDEFSLGLWVGEQTTPNKYGKAREVFDGERNAVAPEGRFILDRCPWCGTRIMPRYHSNDDRDYGVRAEVDTCEFFCPREACRFHDRLPIAVVDQDLYKKPPTFLLGTVDKFARLAWEREAGKLFGAGTGNAPPSLVIQDELHLLTGPLGTTVGLYEAAVIGLCSAEGTPPKVVASTATIRRADDQVKALYGSDVQLFPPGGLDARDSYFAEEDGDEHDPEHKPGRRYLGVMAPGHTAGRATVAIAAAMLQGAAELPEEHRDRYWTLVAYHQSLRELGRTGTAASDEIPAELRGLADPDRGLLETAVEELSSRRDRYEQPGILDRLARPWDDPRAVSFLTCTNMLSVGVDVGRLALMLMLGQPKTTSEYIQATSRVGRSDVPGLVLTFLNATRPRDRSHYESFGVYHRSLYRQVEPTSLTPWSSPSIERALQAVLVILVRHRLGLTDDAQAGDILEHLDDVKMIAAEIAGWAARSSPEDALGVRELLEGRIGEWAAEAQSARDDGKRFYYHTKSKQYGRLLKDFGQERGLWETPQSMRNVDRECKLDVMEGF